MLRFPLEFRRLLTSMRGYDVVEKMSPVTITSICGSAPGSRRRLRVRLIKDLDCFAVVKFPSSSLAGMCR